MGNGRSRSPNGSPTPRLDSSKSSSRKCQPHTMAAHHLKRTSPLFTFVSANKLPSGWSQEHIQMSQITSVCHQYEARIRSWERQAINLVKKVAENMKCCTDGKDKKIVHYKQCLTDKKAEQRACLEKMLKST